MVTLPQLPSSYREYDGVTRNIFADAYYVIIVSLACQENSTPSERK